MVLFPALPDVYSADEWNRMCCDLGYFKLMPRILDTLLVYRRSISTKKERKKMMAEKKRSDRMMIGDSLCGAGPDCHEAVRLIGLDEGPMLLHH